MSPPRSVIMDCSFHENKLEDLIPAHGNLSFLVKLLELQKPGFRLGYAGLYRLFVFPEISTAAG